MTRCFAILAFVLSYATGLVQPPVPQPSRDKEIKSLKDGVERLKKDLADLRADRDRKIEDLQRKLMEAESRALMFEMEQRLMRMQERAHRIQRQDGLPNPVLPRATYAVGKVEKIDEKDKALVEISYENDARLETGDMLEVFRIVPQAKYLGKLEVVDATTKGKAVGKFTPIDKNVELKPGDQVASQIVGATKKPK